MHVAQLLILICVCCICAFSISSFFMGVAYVSLVAEIKEPVHIQFLSVLQYLLQLQIWSFLSLNFKLYSLWRKVYNVLLLQKLGILRAGQKVEDHLYFESLFKSVWADNADVISTQYSGTGALKTDFTRTGKRTRWGLIRDAINTLARYYKNNFADGFRQVRKLLSTVTC